MRKIYFLAIVLVFSLISCGEYPCAKALLHFRLVGFSDAEADTIVLKRFNKNTTTLVDSFTFDVNSPVRFYRFGDTLVPFNYPPHLLMQTEYDYQLELPGANTTFGVTEITENPEFRQKSLFRAEEDCVNELTSLKLNGQPLSAIQFPNSIYLRK